MLSPTVLSVVVGLPAPAWKLPSVVETLAFPGELVVEDLVSTALWLPVRLRVCQL